MNIEPLPSHYDVILFLGQDYKERVHVGRSWLFYDVTQQSTREIVGQYQIAITADHDWNEEKVIPPVTLRMNITEIAGKCLYSVGTNVLRRIFILVHNATTDGSTGIKHIVNMYQAPINLSIKSRSAPSDQFIHPLTYHVWFENGDGNDHRGTTFPNQVVYLGIFLVGNMETLVVNSGCPGIYTLTYARD